MDVMTIFAMRPGRFEHISFPLLLCALFEILLQLAYWTFEEMFETVIL